MAKAKAALTPIKKEYWVEKRNVLNQIRENGMTLQEWRFFTIYLAKINHRDPQTRVVRFPLEDFQRIMEFGRLNIKQLKDSTDRLLCKIMHVPLPSGGYEAFQFFKKCKIDTDNNGEWYMEINAHDEALPFFFQYKTHYFKYQLWNALRLRSVNQFHLYENLKQYEKAGERIMSLLELRGILNIAPDEYPRWSDFKLRVLDSCQQALAEKTDIKFTYEPHGKRGKGGKILALKFVIEKNTDYIDQLTLDEFIELQDEYIESEAECKESQYDEHLKFIAGACDYEFTNIEMQMIATATSAIRNELRLYDFIRAQYMKLLRRIEKKEVIHSRFDYLLKIIKNEVEK